MVDYTAGNINKGFTINHYILYKIPYTHIYYRTISNGFMHIQRALFIMLNVVFFLFFHVYVRD